MATRKDPDSAYPEEKFRELYLKATTVAGLTPADIAQLPALSDIRVPRKSARLTHVVRRSFKYLLLLLLLLCSAWHLDWPVEREKLVRVWFKASGVPKEDTSLEKCVVRAPNALADVFRPPVDCGFCRNVSQVSRLQAVEPEDFEELFAYSGRPVVVVDATKNWSALHTFSFEFFQRVYRDDSPALRNLESRCQFFPYKTEFRSLREVFLMHPDRAQLKDGSKPWYIGWSNCDATAGNLLRQHYQRPYFLPRSAESSKTDWIFMGSPGYGAHMHVDNVHLPSWQAQVTGTKRWTLEPPSECYTQCVASVQVDVAPGDIIVLDTNKWFHSTLNIGNDISITIGSEYD